jgi:hypothetical protein
VGQRLGTRLLRDAPAERSQSVIAAEDDTRAFLDERAAVHLRRLRDM